MEPSSAPTSNINWAEKIDIEQEGKHVICLKSQ